MPPYAAVAFPLGRQDIAAGADLAAYPASTLRYLRERGQVTDTATGTFKCAKPFGTYILDAAVLPASFEGKIFRQLLADGYVIGA